MTTHPISRRGALKVLGAVALSGVAGQLLIASRAKAALAPEAAGLNDFIEVSRTLTGKSDLNAGLAMALYTAFQKATPEIDAALVKLKITLAQDGILGDRSTFTEQQKAEQGLSQAILQGWYLGTVGKAKKAVCVAYADTLSNQAVAGTLVPPSFSYGPCGSWHDKP